MTYTITRISPAVNVTLDNGTTKILTRENIRKIGNLLVLPLPLSDSIDTQAFDYMGVVKEFSLNGVIIDTQANVATFMNSIMNILNGNQSFDGNVTYHSDLMNANFSIKVDNFDFTLEPGTSSTAYKLEWSLKLVESDDV